MARPKPTTPALLALLIAIAIAVTARLLFLGASGNETANNDVAAPQNTTIARTPSTGLDATPDQRPSSEPGAAEVLDDPTDVLLADYAIRTSVDDQSLYLVGPVVMQLGGLFHTAEVLDPADSGQWSLVLTLTQGGSDALNAVAANLLGKQLAMELDGVVLSAPAINATDLGGAVIISGNQTEQELRVMQESINGLVLREALQMVPTTDQQAIATMVEARNKLNR